MPPRPDEPTVSTTHRVIRGDARALQSIDDASVGLVVTSPPYPMVEMWDPVFASQSGTVAEALAAADGPRAFEAMHALLDEAWASCTRVLRHGGFLCINIGDATRSIGDAFALYPNHARITQAVMRLGLTQLPGAIWRKQTNAPNKFMGSGMLPAGAYLTLEHEHVLVFRKEPRRTFSTDEERLRRAQSAYFWEERNAWFSDVWEFRGVRQAMVDPEVGRRSAAFPVDLAYRLIQMYSIVGDTVLDPFVGTGTTLLAAAASARNSVGVDSDPSFCTAATERLRAAGQEAEARARTRLADHEGFVDRRLQMGKTLRHENAAYGPVVTSQETRLILWTVQSLERAGGQTRIEHAPYLKPHTVAVPAKEQAR